MSRPGIERELMTRRGFLAAAASLAASGAAGAATEKNLYAPFRMGVQSYSLRAFSAEQMLQMTQTGLKLQYLEGFSQHFPITADRKALDGYRALLRKYGIQMRAYGVVNFTSDEADARRTFDFARAMDVRMLSAYPLPGTLDMLDRLVDEYRINIGIHNHGPGDALYDRIDKVLKAITGHHQRIGVCIDTGHELRSDQDPVEAARIFGKRVYGIHLKDVRQLPNGDRVFTEIGKGLLDTVGLLKVLKKNGFPGRGMLSLEYEDHADNPMPYMEQCLSATQAAVKTVNSA
ncbi:MAG: sugar phosphate isomerase/epimerase [Armatimonadetes bacterium]|nr:sugar phosphate isomerase/epimerase [Armatimonadota bacterium]MDE2206222.1 sugar phosphate isomerase/epimerase [Armatimonadota bacterium]